MRSRVALLGAQALCLGVSCALLIVSATSIFLTTYGAGLLPYVYIAVAIAGVVVTALMGAVQRRLSLAGLAATVLASVAALLVAGWGTVALLGWTWTTFPLVVLVFLWIPIGFVLVGAQSGRLLDIQQLKAWFPRIAAGFAAGFGLGGLLAARLVTLLGSPASLLLVAAGVVLAFLVLATVLARRHPVELRSPPDRSTPTEQAPVERASFRRLLDNRLVVALLGYQLLSAAVTQLLDYLVWSSAAERYPDPHDLARFLGLFGALINAVGLLFVFTLAGFLLSRYGVRFGLAANPVGVVVLVAVSTVVSFAGGAGTTVLFVLVCLQQVVDIALTDGTTRGSINAAYQALLPRERLAAQTRVEGVGVPGATGAVGVLLVVAHLVGAGITTLLVVVLVLTAIWLALAVSAYRLYGRNLQRTLTRRAWDPVALRLDDAASREVVTRLLHSDDPRDVAVAIDALATAAPDDVAEPVAALLRSDDLGRVRLGVLAARRHGIASTVPTLVSLATSASHPDDVRAAAVVACVDLGSEAADLVPLLDDASSIVRTAATVALVRARGRAQDVRRLDGLLGGGGAVATHTLHALADLPSPLCVASLVRAQQQRPRPVGLTDALAAHAPHLVDTTERALEDRQPSESVVPLVRAIAVSTSPRVDDVLLRHVRHPDLAVRSAVVDALSSRGPVPDDPRLRDALAHEAERTARALDALSALGDAPRSRHLVRALRDDVRSTAERSAAVLGALHGDEAVRRSVATLATAGRPLALEALEVMLGRADTALGLGLVDPTLSDADRRARIAEGRGRRELNREQWLAELVLDPEGFWHDPWLRAAAVAALDDDTTGLAAQAATDPDAVVSETARAVLDGTFSAARG